MLKNYFTKAAQKETAALLSLTKQMEILLLACFRLFKNSICEASRSKERGVLFCTPQGRATMTTKQMEIFQQPD
ncbi:MAG: hypothetical protein A2052_09165 [Deltaproteobacteria bacterium GWA2_54_12]|nr:MAG: hypothetical protein A2052_09165 [Deltaproteobacteria bacterium GWA2_54_12]